MKLSDVQDLPLLGLAPLRQEGHGSTCHLVAPSQWLQFTHRAALHFKGPPVSDRYRWPMDTRLGQLEKNHSLLPPHLHFHIIFPPHSLLLTLFPSWALTSHSRNPRLGYSVSQSSISLHPTAPHLHTPDEIINETFGVKK